MNNKKLIGMIETIVNMHESNDNKIVRIKTVLDTVKMLEEDEEEKKPCMNLEQPVGKQADKVEDTVVKPKPKPQVKATEEADPVVAPEKKEWTDEELWNEYVRFSRMGINMRAISQKIGINYNTMYGRIKKIQEAKQVVAM